ncbi:MAG TPA: pentapeptide repeat-containing protein [Tepidisphaeraceae bacterium]|nr:pentapeptide repeat-containing protein [Tepidisphaeraceae bacterium]
MAQLAWRLSRWSLFKVLAYAETFSVLVALIFWVAEASERKQQKHYQAWQVINTAQGKGGNGGRLDALEQLNDDHVPLVGVDVNQAYLQGIHLEQAELRRATFAACDLRNAHFRRARLADTTFTSANLRGAELRGADLSEAALIDADLTDADFRGAKLSDVNFSRADLRGADLAGVRDWKNIAVRLANVYGIKNPPDGFVKWAKEHGAVELMATDQWNARLQADAPAK